MWLMKRVMISFSECPTETPYESVVQLINRTVPLFMMKCDASGVTLALAMHARDPSKNTHACHHKMLRIVFVI